MFKVSSSTIIGIDAFEIDVEADVSTGFFAFNIVGLPDTAVKESKERILSAMRNCGHYLPKGVVTVNLAPAGLRKEGAAFDLPIALALLGASGEINGTRGKEYMILGELSLDGAVRPIRGAINAAITARNDGKKGVIVPKANAPEAAVVDEIEVIPVESLSEAARFLDNEVNLTPTKIDSNSIFQKSQRYDEDFSDVRGQAHAKRAVEVAGAGGHNILMIGPPGSGKTMLARRLPSILPQLTLDEAIEVTRIHSVAGLLDPKNGLVTRRPYSNPHHTISNAGLVGGGAVPMPGEISIAHNGVLFLDELPEFQRNVLEVLRQPLEDGHVTISRAKTSVSYPARFMLVAAMNPCPCGWHGSTHKECNCTPAQIQRYRTKISGPLLDRIDIHLEVPAVTYNDLAELPKGESSAVIRNRIEGARRMQRRRFSNYRIFVNSQMSPRIVENICEISDESHHLLEAAMKRFNLTARAYHRILKVARTIADLESSTEITTTHISEAIQYRTLDREEWSL